MFVPKDQNKVQTFFELAKREDGPDLHTRDSHNHIEEQAIVIDSHSLAPSVAFDRSINNSSIAGMLKLDEQIEKLN